MTNKTSNTYILLAESYYTMTRSSLQFDDCNVFQLSHEVWYLWKVGNIHVNVWYLTVYSPPRVVFYVS